MKFRCDIVASHGAEKVLQRMDDQGAGSCKMNKNETIISFILVFHSAYAGKDFGQISLI